MSQASQLVVVVVDSLPCVLCLGQLHQELLHPSGYHISWIIMNSFLQRQPEQGSVLPGPEEVLDEHPVVQLERERLHGVVDDRHLKQKSNVK